MVWTLYIYKYLKFSSIFRIWTIIMPQRDCKNWTCNHQTWCLCNYCWATCTCHVSFGRQISFSTQYFYTNFSWLDAARPQPLIKKMLRVGKEDRTHDPEQGNQEPHHYATCWFVHISKFFINKYLFFNLENNKKICAYRASNSDHQDQKGKPYQLLYTFGCDDDWYYLINRRQYLLF